MAQKKSAPAAKPETKALTVIERAVAALGYNVETVKDLKKLAGESESIKAITNTAGYDQCHAARMVLKNRRIEITNAGKTARDDAQKFSKAVIAEEQRLIAIIEPEEKRLQKLQDDHDDAIEAEKQRLIQLELDRVNALTQRLERIRTVDNALANASSEQIAKVIGMLEQLVVDASFEEYEQQASDAKGGSLLRLRDLHAAAVAREVAAEVARKNAAELEQLRKEKAERDERDRKAAAEEQARRDEIARVERIRLATEAAASVQAPQTVAPQHAHTAGATYTYDAPAILARVEESKSEPRPEPLIRRPERPSFDQIVDALCQRFEVEEDTVRSWICENVVMASEAA